jgi:hypothetical protein
VPTPTGDIHISCDKDTLCVINDTDGTGTLRWQGQEWQLPPHGRVCTDNG